MTAHSVRLRLPNILAAAAMLCLSAIAAPSARAAESAAVTTDHDTVTLVTDQQSWAPGRALGVGLRLKLAPGWHTYWSNPGDAGEAATIAVTASGGGAGETSTIVWPVPERLPEGPLMSYAYTGDVLLPLKLLPTATPGQDGAKLVVKATAEWLACATVCVPEQGTFSITLPAGPAAASPQTSPEAGLFDAAREAAPRPSPFAAHIARDGTFTLTGAGLSPTSVAAAWLFPASPGLIDQTAMQTPVIHDGSIAIPLKPASGFKPDRPFDALVVLRDPAGQQSALTVSAAPGASTPVRSGSTTDIPDMLMLALVGGLILNLMPCVFPVLAMKAMALSKLSGLARREQRLSALFYTAGILVAFGALGGLTLSLRAAGSSVGWGFQFQSLAFVAATCWLLFLVGLNLVGAFEVGGSLTGAGQELAGRRGHVGDFATGLLAVLVATPCTAPFMAGALAGALSAPALVGMSVFLVMGLGLALPYLLFACIPRLASSLPRPGAWMDILKQAMAFPIFAACAWLAWVASTEGGSAGVLTVAAGLVLLGTAAWLFGLSQRLAMSSAGTDGVRGARFSGFLSLAFLLAALAMLPGLGKASSGGQTALAGDGWEAFSETKLASLRQSGRPVLVDMSAAWCVSCLVNERIAFRSASVRAAFAEHHVALLKGDWTLRDEAITRFLQAHGRDGVPFYIYYPAGADGQVWPQILTPSLVLHAIGTTAAQ
ncbi:MAG: protein-disulfide reductase DsbD family protein [Janthinobacterium lividum]